MNEWVRILVLEFPNEASLKYDITKRKAIPEKEALEILKQILLWLYELHCRGIVHRGIDSSRIFRKNGMYKLLGLGFDWEIYGQ